MTTRWFEQVSMGIVLGCGMVGMMVVAFWLLERMATMVARCFGVYRVIAEYIWHRKEFKKWLKQKHEQPLLNSSPSSPTARVLKSKL